MKAKINYLAILIFYIIAITCRYLSNKTDLFAGVENEYFKIVIGAVGPAIGAIVVFYLFKIKPVLTFKGNYRKIYFPFILFWSLPIIVITATAYFIKGTLPFDLVFFILVYGLLEELGWRGFLHQQLKSLPQVLSILIMSVLWFSWHLNFEMSSSNLIFFGIIIFGSWGLGKVADKTYSLLAVAAFHSLNNFFADLDLTKTITIISFVIIWIIGIKFRKQIEKITSANKSGAGEKKISCRALSATVPPDRNSTSMSA